jgi:hypothetical protein
MDQIAKFPAQERAQLFKEAADLRPRISSFIMEKDFWVCWSLKRIFTSIDFPCHFIFKGGTSLSKIFNVIERFSEDVDLSFDRRELGFESGRDPERATSGKKQQALLNQLQVECTAVIRDRLVPTLLADFETVLGPQKQGPTSWGIEIDPYDRQTVAFRYPIALASEGIDVPPYIRPAVRLELGARSDSWPANKHAITPYAAELFPRMFQVPSCQVNTLEAVRTFWEKATLLHAEFHRTIPVATRERFSRHYCDLYQLSRTDIAEQAMKKIDLLERVVEHKTVFFRSAWAHYRTAKPGSFHLLPQENRAPVLQRDYEQMKVMIFGEPPTWDEITKGLGELEHRINEL